MINHFRGIPNAALSAQVFGLDTISLCLLSIIQRTRFTKVGPWMCGIGLLIRIITANLAVRNMLPFGELNKETAENDFKFMVYYACMVVILFAPVHHLFVLFWYLPLFYVGRMYQQMAFEQIAAELTDTEFIFSPLDYLQNNFSFGLLMLITVYVQQYKIINLMI